MEGSRSSLSQLMMIGTSLLYLYSHVLLMHGFAAFARAGDKASIDITAWMIEGSVLVN